MIRNLLMGLVLGTLLVGAGSARAKTPPSEITIGSLYTSTGPYASVSMPSHAALEIWVHDTNAAGGAYVKAFHRRIPLKLVSYNDQGDTATVATLTDRLITQNKVDILVSDFGSVLTSASEPVAHDHKMLLIDEDGTGSSLFSKINPYIILAAQPVTAVQDNALAGFLDQEARTAGIERVAILYSTNDFSGAIAQRLHTLLNTKYKKAKVVYFKGVPTSTSNYALLIQRLAASHPNFVVEVGYPSNDIAFMEGLSETGETFPGVFIMYAGYEPGILTKALGADALKGTFTFATGLSVPYKPTAGLTTKELHQVWGKLYPNGHMAFGLNAITGYVSGVLIGQMLANAPNLTQNGLRAGAYAVSGKLMTINGTFELDSEGRQVGMAAPIAQVWPNGKGGLKFSLVYPPAMAKAKAVFGGRGSH